MIKKAVTNPWRMRPEEQAVTITKNPYSLSIFFNWLPQIQLNSSHGHWATRYQKIRAIKTKVGAGVYPHRPEKPLKKARLVLIRHSSREPDYDNLVASFKPVIDALTEFAIIENDNSKVVGQPEYRWIKCKIKFAGINILVQEVTENDDSGGRG